ncbi:MAG: cell wall-binding protein [Eubacteriales bacterium]|nr:cell wall-binding protein [Eubacteriales bacterium]
MKKNFRYLAVLSTAAVMAAVTPETASFLPDLAQTAFAASAGWVTEDGQLRFKDSEGYYVTDSWKKRDNQWYYLDEDGFITRSSKVDEYYVDEDGKRVSNCWVEEENEDAWDEDQPETWWSYYGSSGKAAVSKWQTIDGREYYFDEEGHMQTGKLELDGFLYYLGEEDGSMKTGWIQLENEDEDAEEDLVWHFFDSSGRMVMNQTDRKINGNYYTFEDGILQTGWYQLPAAGQEEAATDSNAALPAIASWKYYEEDGKRAEGWYQIEGAPGISEEGEIYTFYFKKGVPLHADAGVEVFTVDSRRFGFNTSGELQTGLQQVNTDDGEVHNFYFGDDGVMRTGRQSIYDEDLDETQTWFFYTDGGSKGRGFHGIRDNSVYNQGLRLDADRDLKYAPVELDGVQYLVNASGSIQKASSSSKSSEKPELGKGFKDVTDANDKVWTVDTNGVIQK